ncbi:alpha/beta hydrolase [Evansella sp. AB-P1]|uniref:alpha/beta hydrolase n=1 Tax=Evansella sp. AB-P1 TaxID=3037653 RepID=UPI00241DDF35|nr:alpha/beta hydrolase [Evansella sp. AB-P1]MDG5789945.1 alpha/beta hydrolase [Evansella sp. AB-P1]
MDRQEKLEWIQDFRQCNVSFEEENPHFHNVALQNYLSFYNFSVEKIDQYRCCFEKVHGKKYFYQFFLKNNPSATIYLVHGYLDHSGGLSRTINYLLQQNYQVVVLDLPGHGFSEGEEGMISSFDDYLVAIIRGYELIKGYCDNIPVIGLGHSTGAALLFHASTERKMELKGLLLVAPLYYPFKWNLFRRILLLSGKVVPQKKRSFKRNSNDSAYRNFVKHDPLQVQVLKAHWINALENWQNEFVDCPTSYFPIYMLQGTKDTTVDWKKNLNFYKEKCDTFQVALFEDARHQLLNERMEIRYLVYKRINAFLAEVIDDDF